MIWPAKKDISLSMIADMDIHMNVRQIQKNEWLCLMTTTMIRIAKGLHTDELK